MQLCNWRFDTIKERYMSLQQYRQKLQRVLFMVSHNQFKNAAQASKILKCHPSTVKRLIIRLRLEGHQIKYEKALKRYVLEEQEP